MAADKISGKQLFALLVCNRLTESALFLGVVTAREIGRDAWLALAVAALGGLVIALVNLALHLKYPQMTIIQYSQVLLGNFFGKLVGFMYILFFLGIVLIILRQAVDFLATGIMPETPGEAFLLLLMGVTVYITWEGIVPLARVSELILVFTLFTILFVLLLVAKDIDLSALQPVLEKGMKPVLLAAATPMGWFGDVLVMTMLLPCLEKPSQARAAALWAIVTSALFIELLVVAVIGVFGSNEAVLMSFPVFSLVRMINIADFLQRIESLLLAIWLVLIFVKLSLFLYAGTTGLAGWLNLQDYRPLVLPVGIIVMVLSLQAFANLMEVKAFLKTIWPLIAVILTFALPLFLLMVSYIRVKGGQTT